MATLEFDIRPMQLALLGIFKEFAKICAKYDLHYYAFYGTALGAVRHKGFIPWDDDFDVAMPREDYLQFVRIANEELSGSLKFVRGGDGYLSPVLFGRIFDVREGIVQQLSKRCNLQVRHPPFLDIFVLDGIPSRINGFLGWWLRRKLIRLCQMYRFPKTVPKAHGSILRWLIHFASRMVGFFASFFYPRTATNEDMVCLMDKVAMRNAFKDSFMVVEEVFFQSKIRALLPKYMLEPPRKMPFADTEIYVPNMVEEFLIRFYDDYMKLPPEQQRIPEHNLGYKGGRPQWEPD